MSAVTPIDIRSDRFELGVNAVVHVLLIFTALTVLFVFVISHESEKGLQNSIDTAIATNLSNSLIIGNTMTNGGLKHSMRHLDYPLEVMEIMSENKKENINDIYNSGLYNTAYFTIGLISVTLVTMLLVMAYGANIRISPMVKRIALANFVIFAVVGGFEFYFFESTAIKFIPIKPSAIMSNVIDSLKSNG